MIDSTSQKQTYPHSDHLLHLLVSSQYSLRFIRSSHYQTSSSPIESPPPATEQPANLTRTDTKRYTMGSPMEMNGGSVIAMTGKNCVAIASDLRLGQQAVGLSADFEKVRFLFSFLFSCFSFVVSRSAFGFKLEDRDLGSKEDQDQDQDRDLGSNSRILIDIHTHINIPHPHPHPHPHLYPNPYLVALRSDR